MRKVFASALIAVALLLIWILFVRSTHDTLADDRSVVPAFASTDATKVDELLEADSVDEPGQADGRTIATRDESAAMPVSDFTPDASPVPAVRRLVGRVLDVDHHEPVRDCRLEFVQEGRSSKSIVTDRLGHFETPAMFAAGIVEVRTESLWVNFAPGVHATIRPSRIWLDGATDPAQPTELELIATPAIRIDIEVRTLDATPATEASVFLSFDPRRERIGDKDVDDSWFSSTSLNCDEHGRASVWVPRDNRECCALDLQAVDSLGIGRRVTFEPPLPTEPIVLVVDDGGTINVRVVDPHGRPLPRAAVVLSDLKNGAGTLFWMLSTDDDGRAMFPGIPSGSYTIRVDDAPTRRTCQQRVDLADGASVDVEIVLPDSQMRLAVSGVALDEDGAPLSGVHLRVSDGPNQIEFVESEAAGTFEVWALPTDEVTVEGGARISDDLFEPECARVAFGTTDFVVRRVRSVEHYRLAITVIDRRTREPIRAAQLFAAAIHPSFRFDRWGMHEGLATVTITDRPNACLLFAARGYRPLVKPGRELRPPVQPSGYITIELEPGFECRLTVVDGATSDPLADVEFIQPSGAVQRSDAQGVVILSAREWPPAYRVEREGYQAFEWDPRDWPAWKSVLPLDKMVR